MSDSQKVNSPLREGKHYYIENGKYVFTAFYLKMRGYCCSNDCRHCPYQYSKSKKAKE